MVKVSEIFSEPSRQLTCSKLTIKTPKQGSSLCHVGHYFRPVKCHAVCVVLTYLFQNTHSRKHRAIVSFVTHFPISMQIFETEFENQKKIRFPNECDIFPPYTSAPFVDVILVYFVLQTKVTGFGHSLFYILDLGFVFYCKRGKIEFSDF